MEFLFFWLTLSAIVGYFASTKNRSGFGWFIFSVFLSPLLGLLVVAIAPKISKAEEIIANKEWLQDARQRGLISKKKFLDEIEKLDILSDSKICPECAESVKKAAKICRFCSHKFSE